MEHHEGKCSEYSRVPVYAVLTLMHLVRKMEAAEHRRQDLHLKAAGDRIKLGTEHPWWMVKNGKHYRL
jgi:hypothetical protein